MEDARDWSRPNNSLRNDNSGTKKNHISATSIALPLRTIGTSTNHPKQKQHDREKMQQFHASQKWWSFSRVIIMDTVT